MGVGPLQVFFIVINIRNNFQAVSIVSSIGNCKRNCFQGKVHKDLFPSVLFCK